MFKNIKERVNARLGREGTAADTAEQDLKEEKDTAKEEGRLIALIEKARSIYIEKGLVGSVEITRSFAAFYRTVSCDIDGVAERQQLNAIEDGVEVDGDESAAKAQELSIDGIGRCVKQLEKRATAYRNKSYKADLSLTSTIYVSGPLVGLVTVSISCTAKVDSLNNSAAAKKSS